MQQPSQWGLLFDAAIATIQHAERQIGGRFLWSFGGGTALMLQIDHRESHDVDLFIDDVQVMPYLNPLTQEYDIVRNPDDYDTDGTRVIKLIYHDLGEIDFICCGDILDDPNAIASIRGVDVRLERPAEIIGKKIVYRGSTLQPRDMFDLAAVARTLGEDYVVNALKQCGTGACSTALASAERFDPDAAAAVMQRLMHRATTQDLPPDAQRRTIDLLRRALG